MRANDVQSESFLLILKQGFYVFKASRSSRKSTFSLGSVFICGSSDREARKLSEASLGEGSDNVAFVLGATAAVLLRFGSPNKNTTLRKKE